MSACNSFMFYFFLNCVSSLSSFTDHLNVLLFVLVNVQISRTAMNGGKQSHGGDPIFIKLCYFGLLTYR